MINENVDPQIIIAMKLRLAEKTCPIQSGVDYIFKAVVHRCETFTFASMDYLENQPLSDEIKQEIKEQAIKKINKHDKKHVYFY